MATVLRTHPDQPLRPGRALRRRLGLVSVITILAASNVVSNRLWPEAYIPWNLAVAALLVVVARGCGVTWADLGLSRATVRRGLGVGAIAFAAVAVLYLVALAIPATREAFQDSRAAGPLGAMLFAALIRIPLGTAVLEEVAFRGVLPGLVGGSWWRRTLVSSGLFGLWHVLPSIGMAGANAAVAASVGGWGTVATCAAAVVGTAAAGVLLSAWRRWGGHLVTPVLAHVATNSLGVLIAWWVVTH
ncbi:Abortive infection protein [Pseudonocardia dioxanivorans CB1190]|uniref:Abortive infection protein n=1 Tax=Pseudonocardia dioxanivorans (strain ATCC 55486 / DSM 44775 / JCM 13855 / CB1190) TaxID=675635 RepID=F4CL94_PSEUX|nr:CPBP family intramembrane glutamic endopeptidase [Pseudonocardia dioxanivorans]AEA25023.1 Abortive infection protein [Pseudonocardia dioxanivorans CB1190]